MKGNFRDRNRNASGCLDPTAYEAIAHADYDPEYGRFKRLLLTIKYIVNIAGFSIDGRIALKDRKTGKIYK